MYTMEYIYLYIYIYIYIYIYRSEGLAERDMESLRLLGWGLARYPSPRISILLGSR